MDIRFLLHSLHYGYRFTNTINNSSLINMQHFWAGTPEPVPDSTSSVTHHLTASAMRLDPVLGLQSLREESKHTSSFTTKVFRHLSQVTQFQDLLAAYALSASTVVISNVNIACSK